MAKKGKPAPAMSPAPVTDSADVEEFNEPEVNEEEFLLSAESPQTDLAYHSDVVANPDIPADPKATIASALLAIGKLYNESKTVGAALTHHINMVVADAELHAVLHRMQLALGDFKHAFEQIDQQMSDRLREEIQNALT